LLFPPRRPDGRTQCLHARIDLCRSHVEPLCREVGEGFLVQLDAFNTDSPDGRPKDLPEGEPFCDRRMIRKGKAVRQKVSDPTGAIYKQCRHDRLASPVLQFIDDIVQALRRKLLLSLAALGDGGGRIGQIFAIGATHHLSGDMIRLKGEAVALAGSGEKCRQYDERLAFVGRNADDDATATNDTKSKPDPGHRALWPLYAPYSHSIVPGGLLVTSYTTRFTPFTSLMMRVATAPMNFMSNG